MPVRRSNCFCCSRKSGDNDAIYSDLIGDTEAPGLVRYFPVNNSERNPVDSQVRSLRINDRDDALVASFLQRAAFPNLEHCEIRLSKGLNVKKATPYLLKHHRTLRTTYMRCVAPGPGDCSPDGRDQEGVRRNIGNFLQTCTKLACLCVSIGMSDFPSANFDIPRALTTELRFARSLRVLKLCFRTFDDLSFQGCDLDLHTIELEERSIYNVPFIRVDAPIDLSKMGCLQKVAVASSRPLILTEDSTSVRKLVLSHVQSLQGNISGVVVLNVSYCATDVLQQLLSSTKDSLRELGLFRNEYTPEIPMFSIGSRTLQALFLAGPIFAKVKTYRKHPLDVLYITSATVHKDQERIYAKQVLIEGTSTIFDSTLPLIDSTAIKSLALEDSCPSNPMSVVTLHSIHEMQGSLHLFASNYVLPSEFPQLPNLKRFFCRSAWCLEKIYTEACTSCCIKLLGFTNKLDLVGLSKENAYDIDSAICQERAERQRVYESAKRFFYESLDKEVSLVSDLCWSKLDMCWQSLLSTERQSRLVGHGAITRSASISTDNDMEQH